MAAPPLRIPVALDLDSLKQQTQKASDHVGEALKGIGRAFTKVNGEIVGSAAASQLAWSQGLAGTALKFAGLATAAVIAFKVIAGAIDLTRDKLKEMVEIADKAAAANVSPQFFQSFVKEAQNLRVSASDMEAALTKAFDATKEKSPIDLAKWEVGEEQITDVEKALRVYNETVAKAAGGELRGLVLFRDADTQEKKALAVLEAMRQLNAIGQNLAALDLGEKMFGTKFVDNIRTGKVTVEGLIKTINDATVSSTDLISNETVQRAKEIDDQLKLANQHLDREMKPTMEGLANDLLKIKSLWADVVELIAQAVGLFNQIDTNLLGRLSTTLLRAAGINPTPAATGKLGDLAAAAGLGDIRIPSRGTGPAPTLKDTSGTAGRDRFDATADSIEKRTAALAEEARTIDLGTEARNRAKIAAELETVAKQLNGTITEEQRKRIDALADAYGKVAAKIEQAHAPLETFARESANLGRQLNQFTAQALDGTTNALADVVTGSKSAAEAFSNLTKSILNDLAKIAIRQTITGPLASALGGVFQVGGGSSAAGPGPIFSPFAEGGPVRGAGTASSDSILARLSNGEFVVNADAASQWGPVLDAMNSGRLKRFAEGGWVNPGSVAGMGGAPDININIINNAGARVQTSDARPDGRGGFDMDVLIEQVDARLADNVANGRGSLNGVLEGRGVRPRFG